VRGQNTSNTGSLSTTFSWFSSWGELSGGGGRNPCATGDPAFCTFGGGGAGAPAGTGGSVVGAGGEGALTSCCTPFGGITRVVGAHPPLRMILPPSTRLVLVRKRKKPTKVFARPGTLSFQGAVLPPCSVLDDDNILSRICRSFCADKIPVISVWRKCTAIRTSVYVLKPPVARSPTEFRCAHCFSSLMRGANRGISSQNALTSRVFCRPSQLFMVTSQRTKPPWP